MKITTIAMMLVVAGVLIGGFYTILGIMASPDNYNVQGINSTIASKYSAFSEDPELAKTQEELSTLQSDEEAQFFVGQWTGVKKSLSLLTSSFGFAFDMAGNLGREPADGGLGLPAGVVVFINTIIIILIIGAILTILLKVKS